MEIPKKDLRIVFMGTPDFAVPSMEAIVDASYQLVGVVTAPDRASGRGRKVGISAVKKYALDRDIPILQPEKFREDNFLSALRAWDAHVFVVVAFRMLPEVVWSMPSMGAFNLHGSLLPQYRGAAPINHAIMNGETETGVTSFLLDEKIDTGQIILRERMAIADSDTFGVLHDKLMHLGASVVVKTLEALRKQNYTPAPQDQFFSQEEALKPAPKIFKEDCRISWEKPLDELFNFIRALDPFPASHTHLLSPEKIKHYIKVFAVMKERTDHSLLIGSVLSDGNSYMKVAVNGGYLHIIDIQIAGKKRMGIEAFLKGFSINDDWMVA